MCVKIIMVIWGSLGFFTNFFTSQAAETHGPACGLAVINGVVNPTEWNNASTKSFQMVNPNNQPVLEVPRRVIEATAKLVRTFQE